MRRALTYSILFVVSHSFVTLPAPAQTKEPAGPRTIQGKRVVAALPANVEQHLELVYAKHGTREMHLDLFAPKDAAGALPTLVVVHGGGWVKGNKRGFHALAQEFARRGYVAAAIEYRLAGEAKFPAAIHDCNAAVRWLRANAKKYHIDPERIGAIGGSAGGHLVGLMAAGSHVPKLAGEAGPQGQSHVLQAGAVMAGPFDLTSARIAELSRTKTDFYTNQWLGKTIDEAPELYELASPITHITAHTPPILFLAGEEDNPARNAETREKLQHLKIETGIAVYSQGKHGCWNQHPWFQRMIDDMDAFFARTLNKLNDRITQSKTAWGVIDTYSDRLELNVAKSVKGGSVSIPRWNNPIGPVYLKHDSAKQELRLRPGVVDWTIALPKGFATGVIVVETKGRPWLPTIPRVVSGSHQEITLHAHDAVTHGQLVRYEPQPHKNTVGYWANDKDWYEWFVYVEEPGTFDVYVLQGCGKGQGGSEVSIGVGESDVRFVVEDTGHFQNFKERKIGSLSIDKTGVHALSVRTLRKAAKAVMDCRQIRLVRRKSP